MKQNIKSFNNLSKCTGIHDKKIKNDVMNMSSYTDENDEIQISENTCSNLYCYNEYVNDTFATNKICHFENILKYNGFVLNCQGEVKTLENSTVRNERHND